MTRAALLTPAEAANELAISEKQLRWLTNAGHIRYVNVGLGAKRECRRYDATDIDQFRDARKCLSTSAQARPYTASTSVIEASDFQARLDARRNAKLRGSRTASANG